MLRSKIDDKLSEMAKSLSPTKQERTQLSKIYSVLDGVLGEYDCSKIGSYPRYTAISPVHDMDILCSLGRWQGARSPEKELRALYSKLESSQQIHENLPEIEKISLQKHSISIEFRNNQYPSIDLIPCYESQVKNEFRDPIYHVPEIAKIPKSQRKQFNLDFSSDATWILSDPKGYIRLAKEANDKNECFRKTTKLLKYWKQSLSQNTGIKLKSFHIEQIVLNVTKDTTNMMESVLESLRAIPAAISEPNQIPDRAQQGKFIDDYVSNLSELDKKRVINSVRRCLENVENIGESSSIKQVFSFYEEPALNHEEFICEKMAIDRKYSVEIDCNIEQNGFRPFKLSSRKYPLKHNLKLDFYVDSTNTPEPYSVFWKVRNVGPEAIKRNDLRGQIVRADNRTHTEHTCFYGLHYVECYIVKGGKCVAINKVNVPIAD